MRSGFQKNRRLKAYRAGVLSERLAALYLRLCGYRIVARRYKTPVGEIDLIACKNDVLAAVEVKARDCLERGIEAVVPRNRLRVERAALYYAGQNPACAALSIRFDIIVVEMRTGVWPRKIRHIRNAWEARG